MFSRKNGENKKIDHPKHYFQMPWTMISEIKKTKDGSDINSFVFEISTKDHRVLLFKVYDPYKIQHKKLTELQMKHNSFHELYCFKFFSRTDLESKHQGWTVFNLESEYRRQGLDFEVDKVLEFQDLIAHGIRWRLVRNYKSSYENLCDSYPEYLMIPSNINPINLQIAIKFRSKNRFPVMTYYWANSDLPRGWATLWRSAQCNVDSTDEDWFLRSLHRRRVLHLLSARPARGRGHQRLPLQ